MRNQRWLLTVAGGLLCSFFPHSLVAATTVLRAGSPFTIDIWSTEDGLPQNSVISMIQTRDGYLWLGTLNGLARFDGMRFAVFNEGNTPELKSSRIVKLYEDTQNNLWVGTERSGAALVKDGRVISLDIGRGSREGRLMAACEDAGGSVWLYTADGQLCRYRDKQIDVWNAGEGRFSACRALAVEKSGVLWVGTDWGIFALPPARVVSSNTLPVEEAFPVNKLDFLLASQSGGHWRLADGRIQKWNGSQLERDLGPYPWTNAAVAAACEDRVGNLVVGTLGEGAYWFDSDGKAVRLSGEEGLSHNYILSLAVDREGSLWVGTDGGGLARVKRQVFQVLEESRGATVQSVSADAEGGVWFSVNSGGLNYWKDGILQTFNIQFGPVNLIARSVFVAGNQHVWAGTAGGGLFQLQSNLFQRVTGAEAVNPEISIIHQDRRGRLWVGTQNGVACWDEAGWKIYTTRDGLSANDIRAIADDAEGNIWLGTGHGLNRLRDGRFAAFHVKDGLPGEKVSSLFLDAGGVLWVGSDGGGLGRLYQGRWTRYTTRDGLVSDSIGYIIDDDQSCLWMGSYAGLMRMSKAMLNSFAANPTNAITCRAYGRPDGLPTSECTQGSQPMVCRARDGKLWFATIKGLVSVNPAQLARNTNPPPVVIESVMVGGRSQTTNSLRAPLPETIIIPPRKERLEIQFTSLNLAARDRARFKYQMEGHETAWTEVGADSRIARYPKLPPGRYQFKITACNEDGVWNETGKTLAIVVLPPFWQTWWFLSATAIVLLMVIVVAVHSFSTQKLQRQLERLRQQEALEKERSRIARDIHDQLGASLTQVALLGDLVEGDKDSPAGVEAHARQISQTARDTTRVLDEIVWTVNPSNDTLEGLINYICKYAQDYLGVAGLRFRLDIPSQLPGAIVSPEVRHNVFLAAKEAITNVVRHAQATSVWLRLKLEPDRFTLEIADDGRGCASSDEKSERSGLRNMRKRLEDMGGSFSIGPAPGKGTLVCMTVPLRKP